VLATHTTSPCIEHDGEELASTGASDGREHGGGSWRRPGERDGREHDDGKLAAELDGEPTAEELGDGP
jgi:hypothetical protein